MPSHHGDQRHGPHVLVARQIPPDIMGEDAQYTQKEREVVPVSLLRKRDHGPRRTRQGRLVGHSLLGDPEEFEEMERSINGNSDMEERHSVFKAGVDAKSNDAGENEGRWDGDATSAEVLAQFNAAMKEAKRKQAEEKRLWLSRLHIFQRYREVREEHALKNWQHHSVEWNRVEERLAKKAKKSPGELLMARLGEYRERLEEHELIDTALRLLDDEHVDFWKTGLRLGSDLLGLTMPIPRGGPRQIERVRSYERQRWTKDHSATIRKLVAPKEALYEDIISLFDPFFLNDESGYLELQGHNPLLSPHLPHLAESYLDRLKAAAATKTPIADEKDETTSNITPDKASGHTSRPASGSKDAGEDATTVEGPHLDLATPRLFFDVELNTVSMSVLTVYNRGTTAVGFEWVPIKKPNPLNIKAVYDEKQRFFFYYKKGVILPGTAFDFPIIFKSATPGVFTEIWSLTTVPALGPEASSQPTVTMQGIALERDDNEAKREKLEKALLRKQALSAAKAIISTILTNIKPRVVSARSLRRIAANEDEHLFEKRNRSFKLYYTPKIFDKLATLASETLATLHDQSPDQSTPAEWDRSVSTLSELINAIMDIDLRSTSLRRLNQLIAAAAISPRSSATSMLHVIVYDTFVNAADRIAETSEAMRRKMGLPLARAATRFDEADDPRSDSDGLPGDGPAPPPNTVQQEKDTSARKATPPVVPPTGASEQTPAVAVPEKAGKKGAGAAATGKETTKKAATSAADKSADKGKGKGGAKEAAATAAAAAAAASAPVVPAATPVAPPAQAVARKEVETTVTHSPLNLSKLIIRPKKPDSTRGWSKERRAGEEAYRAAFRAEVRQLLTTAIDRMSTLLGDATCDVEAF
ncbi:MYCBP-associated protein family-domain-containing protein [Fimicolochytrium jonesii]|uniref:MYCBP-associated protein family-domain-containing protein n=1 Tax=Fimicolochytrium jonesii TaxID=1396493 RepID=UPI0022FE7C0C|nr:MYCBP-associated protein family-domain-containing protein [Fimicolochytrium jonesii]KAI8822671.1 MYCBP-associated protein family-domain-containing protein [Fimicolochytrium jonesii]